MPTLTDAELADLRALIAKQAIAEALARYGRGIDRCDLETLLGVFWPDARADYGSGWQGAADWCAATVDALRGMHRTMHSIGNVLIELTGDTATAETYCHAYHELDGPDGLREMVVGGRYLDRFERRAGEWKIAERLYVMDWNRNTASTAQWDGFYAALKRRGARKPDDPLYAVLGGPGARTSSSANRA